MEKLYKNITHQGDKAAEKRGRRRPCEQSRAQEEPEVKAAELLEGQRPPDTKVGRDRRGSGALTAQASRMHFPWTAETAGRVAGSSTQKGPGAPPSMSRSLWLPPCLPSP